MLSLFFFIDRLCRLLSIFRPGQDAKLIVFSLNFDKVGSNGLGAFGSCPIPDVNFLFIFYFF